MPPFADVLQWEHLPFPKSLRDFQRLFHDDYACARYLEGAKWPKGFVCMCKPDKHETKEPRVAHVFEGQPDSRQADTAIPVSRFRPKYRALTDDEKVLHDALKNKAAELEELYAKVKPGRYNSLAVTSLEQSVMWIVKELTS